MENLRNSHPLGKEQGRLSLLLQRLLDTSQGLSLEFRMSRGIQTHFAQHWKYHQSQLRAEIIPRQNN